MGILPAMNDCTPESPPMTNADWAHPDIAYPFRCYFYPGRACPLWRPGGTCGRIMQKIPGTPSPQIDELTRTDNLPTPLDSPPAHGVESQT